MKCIKFYILILRKNYAVYRTTGRIELIDREFLGRQRSHFATGILTVLTRDADKGTAELLEEQRTSIEARKLLNRHFGRNT
jgi:predicted glycosyl hydrolase (DUF1957 family)